MGHLRRHAAAAALAAVLLTGCGQDTPAARDDAPTPSTTPGPALLAEVTGAMREAGGVRYVFSGIGGGETQAGAGTMQLDAASYEADVTLTMPQTGRIRAVLCPGESFLALPAAKGLPKDKPWLKVSATSGTPIGRQLRPVVEQLRAAFDPALTVGLLQATDRLEELGPARVEGVSTTHYRSEVRLRKAVRTSVGPAQEQYQSMLDAGATTVQYDVWVDVSGLPRRYTIGLPSGAGLFSVTGVYRDWGTGTAVEAPGADEVYDADKLTGRIGPRAR